MAQDKILRLQGQPGSEARPQGMKPDENGRFHRTARLPAETTNRIDFNAVGFIGMHNCVNPHTLSAAKLSVKLLVCSKVQKGCLRSSHIESRII
jgi:hypothetical protein